MNLKSLCRTGLSALFSVPQIFLQLLIVCFVQFSVNVPLVTPQTIP